MKLTHAIALLAALAGTAAAPRLPGAPGAPSPAAPRGSAFALFATRNLVLDGNRVQCNINASGEFCVDATNSPVYGGGFWPRLSPDQYVFNGGLQVSAIIPAGAPGPWAGDTVGAYFFDARGDQNHGEAVTNVYDSRTTPADGWPSAALVSDPALFHPVLLGRQAASEQDSWVRYWDGDPRLRSGRVHPMGLLVEQRTLAWNYPLGNEDILYQVYRFVNVTSSDAADYAGLADVGYGAADIAGLAELGRIFQERMRADGVELPAHGFPFSRLYVGYGEDPDVGNAGSNYSNASLVFDLAAAYKSNFQESYWSYPPEIFFTPFAAAPGFVSEIFLSTPSNRGITMFTNTTGGGWFGDRVGVQALWRLQSLNLTPSDGFCSASPSAQERRFCLAVQSAADTRFYIATGPATLGPGQALTVVMAKAFAAPVASMSCSAGEGACPGGSWSLAPFITTSYSGMMPGYPLSGTRLVQGLDTVRNFDRAMGWVSGADADADGAVEWNEVTTVQRSLLWKTQLAHAMLVNRFLTPQPPAEPQFMLLPGDGRVTVVWRPSATEETGDAYYDVAANAASPLYDPAYRKLDVEGYRVWRGTSPSTMQLVAEFDARDTYLHDVAGQVLGGMGNQCAPELGMTTTCPAFPRDVPLAGEIVQVRPGDRVTLSNGALSVVRADTARARLWDTGIPYQFVDTTARNGVDYYYAVTVFDVNSWRSGPSSFESPMTPRRITPRIASGQETGGGVGPLQIIGGDGQPLDPAAPEPTVNATAGIFSGPQPATNGIALGFARFLPQLVDSGSAEITIDSIVPGSALSNTRPTRYYLTSVSGGLTGRTMLSLQQDGENVHSAHWDEPASDAAAILVSASTGQAARFGGDSTLPLAGEIAFSTPGSWGLTMKGRAYANAHPDAPYSAPRWWVGAGNENVTNPNGINCITQTGTFSCSLSDLSRNVGQIPGVDIFGIMSYFTIASSSPQRDIEGVTSTVMRAADIRLYWGASGAVDSVVDVTHHLRVPFSSRIRASWGFLTDSSFVNVPAASTRDTSNARLTWTDTWYVPPLPSYITFITGAAAVAASPDSGAPLMDHARLSPVAFASSTAAGSATLAANGNGFILYLNGYFFLMRMAALPPAGTVWNARFFAGHVTGTPGAFAFTNGVVRPPAVPGLRMRFSYTGTTFTPQVTTSADLERVHTVPDPYYLASDIETGNDQRLRFVNVPAQAIIRVYSTSGILVAMVVNNDPTGGGEATWDVRNRAGRPVASGVYFWHLVTADGRQKVGRFTVVNGRR